MQFRTKARAVDLLGKGQIADLPTAITELWKNGYDAYADNLKAELFKAGYNGLSQSYFVISDDGKGMSHYDILEKWLVLGTDSKSRALLDEESEETLWKSPRIKAGEKGIGRLSVAYLGNPMLMLTKKLGHPLQAVFFDWRLLENYNLFLDDIVIPLMTLESLDSLETTFENLKNDFLTNFEMEYDSDDNLIWEGKEQVKLRSDIVSETKNSELETPILKNVSRFFDSNDSHGTIFLIFNPISQIIELSERDEDNLEDINFVTSSLTGFANPFKNNSLKINTSFDIHSKSETYDLLQSRGEFFSQQDFNLADVYIKGEFDGEGTFNGKVRIFDKTIDYSFVNPRKKTTSSFYGKIPIELGYSQGEEKSSILSEVQFSKISKKVKEYGGLYVYRDDFRVLPYGRENQDFLNFELRRSKRAGTYYFSYRRMFGYIDLTRKRNPDLKDKSSREGLINNAKYRAFTSDATNMFIALAQDYFATEPKISIFRDQLLENQKQNKALQADKDREKKEKIAFTKSLNEYPEKLIIHQNKNRELLSKLENQLNQVHISYTEIENILEGLHKLELELNDLIPKIPTRYQPTETQNERLYKFENSLTTYLKEVNPKRESLISKAQERLEVKDLQIDLTRRYNNYISSLDEILNKHKQNLDSKFKSLLSEYNARSRQLIDELLVDKDDIVQSISSKEQVLEKTTELEKLYQVLLNKAENTLIPLTDHVNRLTFEIDENQVQGAYKAQYDQMKFQWEQTRDTAQLGIAVEIIDHEFNHLYAKINHQLKILSSKEQVRAINEFSYLEKNFKQLEDKYALLSPLYRISGALRKDVSCKALYDYLLEFFENQLNEYEITVEISESFKNHNIHIKEPIIYTVFINIFNNAIYWMRNKKSRVIKLDYLPNNKEILIINSGEKISDFKLNRIFDLFYSQRPNGRGIGLYLSKQSLNDAGFDIYATNDPKYNALNGACFIINQINQ